MIVPCGVWEYATDIASISLIIPIRTSATRLVPEDTMITCRIGNPGYLYQRLLMTTLQPKQRNCSFLAEKLTTDGITSPAHKYHLF